MGEIETPSFGAEVNRSTANIAGCILLVRNSDVVFPGGHSKTGCVKHQDVVGIGVLK